MNKDPSGRVPEENDDSGPGSVCEIYELYRDAPDAEGGTSWTHDKPCDLVAPAENSLSSKYALIVRKVKCYDGKKSLKIHSIVIQSEHLKKVLVNVMSDYPGLTLSLSRVKFEEPFRPFVHRWEQFCEAIRSEEHLTTLTHAKLLFDVLEEELKDTISRKHDHIQNNVMTHDLLWALFEPGSVILSVVDGHQRAFKFHSSTDDRNGNFAIAATYVDWDGYKFGYSTIQLQIKRFEGTSPIMDLSVCPLVYHNESIRIREDLVCRGKIWEGYKGYHYKQYDGPTKGRHWLSGNDTKVNIRGRIVINTEAYNIFQPDSKAIVSGNLHRSLSKDQLLITTPILRGYTLKEKNWLQLFVDNIKDIT